MKNLISEKISDLQDTTIAKHNSNVHGHVIIRNPITGKIIDEGPNLVVLRGRLHVLQMLTGFDLDPGNMISGADPETWSETFSANKRIGMFMVGTGANPTGIPTDIVAPEWNNWYLEKPVPFVVGDENRRANTHYLKGYMPVDDQSESLNTVVSDGYYGKTFDAPPVLVYDASTSKAFLKILFSITGEECRGHIISEIGLLLANHTQGTIGDPDSDPALVFEEPPGSSVEMFSRYTMAPRDFTVGTQGYEVEYQIYV